MPDVPGYSLICEARLDRAVRKFIAQNYPVMGRTWLKNRDAWQIVSPLDLRAIRAAYAADDPYTNKFMGW